MLLFADDVTLIAARMNIDDLQRDLHHAWDWASVGTFLRVRTSMATSLSVLLLLVS